MTDTYQPMFIEKWRERVRYKTSMASIELGTEF